MIYSLHSTVSSSAISYSSSFTILEWIPSGLANLLFLSLSISLVTLKLRLIFVYLEPFLISVQLAPPAGQRNPNFLGCLAPAVSKLVFGVFCAFWSPFLGICPFKRNMEEFQWNSKIKNHQNNLQRVFKFYKQRESGVFKSTWGLSRLFLIRNSS